MKNIDILFGRMDAWRHLPNYQLERRADIFFSLYLPEVLEKHFSFPVKDVLVPEFPVHINTICPDKPTDKSYKIDYVAFSEDGDRVFLVELKTDDASRRGSQDIYLCKAKKEGLERLIDGLKKIFMATAAKRKYFHLFDLLEKAGMVSIPDQMRVFMNRSNLQGLNELIREITYLGSPSEIHIVYVQPNDCREHKPDLSLEDKVSVITFKDFAEVVKGHKDVVSHRFAQSLETWASVIPGNNA